MPTNQTLALILGESWTSSAGQPVALNYTILGSTTSSYTGSSAGAVNAQFAQAVTLATQAWANVANISFQFVQNSLVGSGVAIGTLPVVFHTDILPTGVLGLTEYLVNSGGIITHADVALDNRQLTPSEYLPGADTYGYQVLLHETGHALGLAHPDDGSSLTGLTIGGNGVTTDGTVMASVVGDLGTHSSVGGVPVTPMLYDIAAMQYLYGANYSYRPGNDSYSFSGAQVSETIWDGGGLDAFNFAGWTEAVTIDLGEGLNNVTQAGEARIWIAFGANIENALGGSGGDIIRGGEIANRIHGNSGADTIFGNGGADFLGGNMEADSILGGADADTIRGGKGNDIIDGGSGHDTLWGDIGDDDVVGGDGIDNLKGNEGNDTLSGGADTDALRGGQGADVLDGGAGNDTVWGDAGNDYLTGGAGNDIFVFTAGSGADVITDFSAGDVMQIAASVFASAGAAVAASSANGGNILVDLGGGNSITLAGVGAVDTGDFTIV